MWFLFQFMWGRAENQFERFPWCSRLKPGRQSCYLRSKGRGRLRTLSTGCMQLYDLGRQVNIRQRFGMFSRLIADLFCTKRVISILIFIYCRFSLCDIKGSGVLELFQQYACSYMIWARMSIFASALVCLVGLFQLYFLHKWCLPVVF